MRGKRLADGFHHFDSQPGDYWKNEHGHWQCKDPFGHVGGLGKHEVTEHEDGTITVSPSILDIRTDDEPAYHGFLEKGIWREA